MTQKFAGREGYVWFIGVVENRKDPLQIGRVQIRCYNIHSQDKIILPTEDLLWATPEMSITSSSIKGVGQSPTGIQNGTTVFGYFLDGNDCQVPLITGTLIGQGDVSPLAIGINNLVKNIIPGSNEPESAYNTKYPYNKVLTTEGGIVVEYDDTPNNKRIHIYHPSGTYKEINDAGMQVDKVVDNHFDIVVKDKNIWIGGNMTVHIVGNATMQVDGDCVLGVNGSMITEVFGDLTAAVNGNLVSAVGGDSNSTVEGECIVNAKGDINVASDVKIALTAPLVSINGN